MKPTTTIVLFLLLAGCVGFVAWPHLFPEKTGDEEVTSKAVFEKLGEISRITVTASDGGLMAFVKTGEDWKIIEPVTAGADSFAVRDIIDKLKGIEFITDKSSDRVGSDITGLDKPGWILTVADDTGNEYELQIGHQVPLGNGKTYVSAGGRVLVVDVNFTSVLSRPLSDYRNKTILDLENVEFDVIKVSARDKYELKKLDNQWRLTSPVAARARAEVVKKLIERLSYVPSRGIAADKPTGLAAYGLDSPQLEVTFSVKPQASPEAEESSQPPRSYTITFGSKVQDEVYVKLAGESTVYRINAALVDAFAPRLADIRDNSVLDVGNNAVVGVELSLPDGSCVLAREGGVWLVDKPFSGKAEPRQVEKLLETLGKLKAESFRQGGLSGFGFDEPRATVSLKLLGKDDKLTLLIGDESSSGEMTFVKTATGSIVYVVRTADLATVFADTASYWKATLLKLADDEKVTHLDIFRADGTYELARGEDDAWKMIKPVKADADRESLTDILDRLDELTATKIVALGTSLPDRFDKADDVITLDVTTAIEKKIDRSEADVEADPGLVKITRKHTLKVARIDGGVYAWLDGVSPVAVGEFDVSLYEALTAELRNRRVVEINVAEVSGFSITSAGKTLEFAGKGDNWQYSGDAFVKIDAGKVRVFLESVASTVAGKFVSHKSSDSGKFGCDRPEVLLEIRLGTNHARQLRVSSRGPKGSEGRYATVDGIEGVFVLDADKVAGFVKSLNDFKK